MGIICMEDTWGDGIIMRIKEEILYLYLPLESEMKRLLLRWIKSDTWSI